MRGEAQEVPNQSSPRNQFEMKKAHFRKEVGFFFTSDTRRDTASQEAHSQIPHAAKGCDNDQLRSRSKTCSTYPMVRFRGFLSCGLAGPSSRTFSLVGYS
jgi:hypothetical protein